MVKENVAYNLLCLNRDKKEVTDSTIVQEGQGKNK